MELPVAPSRTRAYKQAQSAQRRADAEANGLCKYCFVRPVSPGTHGSNDRPWKTCFPCRVERAEAKQSERKAAQLHQAILRAAALERAEARRAAREQAHLDA